MPLPTDETDHHSAAPGSPADAERFGAGSIRPRLLVMLVLIAVVSAGASALAAFHLGRQALEQAAFDKLTAVRELKADQVEDYFRRIRDQVVVFSNAPTIVRTMRELKQAHRAIAQDVALDEEQLRLIEQRLRRYYQEEFLPRLSTNLDSARSLPEVWPSNNVARLLQGLYIADNPFGPGSKHLLERANRGSRYSDMHLRVHPYIRDFLERFGYYDIFLVDSQSGEVLYSVFKEVDFGTSLLHGPWRDTGLAAAFRAARETRDRNFHRLVDFAPYPPSYNAAASFIASPIFDGDEQIGVVVFQMPVDRLDRIMTSDRAWKEVGLGSSGETYIVADDFRMRSRARFLVEDKARYLAGLRQAAVDERVVGGIESLDSTIGLLEMRTPATEQALDGATGTQMFADARGQQVLAAFRPLTIPDVDWVLVSEMERAEAFAAIRALGRSLLVVLVAVVAGSIVLGIIFARGLTRPLRALSARATELARGNLDVEIDTSRRDEIGQLARSFAGMRKAVKSLVQRQEAAIDALSTPLIPLRDGVVVMPLVGDFDRRRIERLRETLVQGIHEAGARVTIIDVTGLAVCDPELGQGLARVTAAARLLGAVVVLTGVQPQVARGLAEGGLHLQDMATRRTLQQGIDFAVQHLRNGDSAR
jgi:anti-anti-sigma regulatory factor/HAMP domain-containing protein